MAVTAVIIELGRVSNPHYRPPEQNRLHKLYHLCLWCGRRESSRLGAMRPEVMVDAIPRDDGWAAGMMLAVLKETVLRELWHVQTLSSEQKR